MYASVDDAVAAPSVGPDGEPLDDGEAFDLVVLASDAIERLMEAGHLLAGSRVALLWYTPPASGKALYS